MAASATIADALQRHAHAKRNPRRRAQAPPATTTSGTRNRTRWGTVATETGGTEQNSKAHTGASVPRTLTQARAGLAQKGRSRAGSNSASHGRHSRPRRWSCCELVVAALGSSSTVCAPTRQSELAGPTDSNFEAETDNAPTRSLGATIAVSEL